MKTHVTFLKELFAVTNYSLNRIPYLRRFVGWKPFAKKVLFYIAYRRRENTSQNGSTRSTSCVLTRWLDLY